MTSLIVLLGGGGGGGGAHKIINALRRATQARAAKCLYVPLRTDVPLSGGKVIVQMTNKLSEERLYKGKDGKNYTHKNTLRKKELEHTISLF
jgi:hypothetical protein